MQTGLWTAAVLHIGESALEDVALTCWCLQHRLFVSDHWPCHREWAAGVSSGHLIVLERHWKAVHPAYLVGTTVLVELSAFIEDFTSHFIKYYGTLSEGHSSLIVSAPRCACSR